MRWETGQRRAAGAERAAAAAAAGTGHHPRAEGDGHGCGVPEGAPRVMVIHDCVHPLSTDQAPQPSRRRDCHFADALSPSLLKRLLTAEEGAAE